MLPPVMALFTHLCAAGHSGAEGTDEEGRESLCEAAGGMNAAGDGAGSATGRNGEHGGGPGLTGDLLLPFAFEETLCRDVGSGAVPPALHLWSHPGGVALGLRDSKLPGAARAMDRLERSGTRTAVRHSGGAAVPLDAGIVNVSLLLPKGRGKLDFHDDFRLLAALIAEAVAVSHPQAAQRIAAGEIKGSYCPGDFDLSIGGRKFCGIAQRRQSRSFFVHAFVIVSGSGQARGEMIRAFYEEASAGDGSLDYPRVRPEVMAGLGELGGPASAAVFADGLKTALARRGIRLEPQERLPGDSGYALDYGDPRVLEAARMLRERYSG